MLRIGIPKGENLVGKVEKLFALADIPLKKQGRSLRVEFPGSDELADGYLLRGRTIPKLLTDWMLDIGIIGEDILAESGWTRITAVKTLLCERIGLGTSRIVLFARGDDLISRLSDIPPGLRIVSEYPRITRKFLKGKVDLRVDESRGGCEAEVLFNYRFGVAVVESGETLKANGLKEICTIFRSNPVLVANKDALLSSFKRGKIEGLVKKLEKVL